MHTHTHTHTSGRNGNTSLPSKLCSSGITSEWSLVLRKRMPSQVSDSCSSLLRDGMLTHRLEAVSSEMEVIKLASCRVPWLSQSQPCRPPWLNTQGEWTCCLVSFPDYLSGNDCFHSMTPTLGDFPRRTVKRCHSAWKFLATCSQYGDPTLWTGNRLLG